MAQSAAAAEAVASAIARIELHAVAARVALAMPGSRSASEAARAAAALSDAAKILAAGLAEHAEALRSAVGHYAGTEQHVLVETRSAAGGP